MSTPPLPQHPEAESLRVVKLGGSLLDLPDLRQRLLNWLSQQAPAINLLVVGGGQMIEAIRELDRIHPLDPERVHWLCVEALGVTADLLSQLLGCPLLDSREKLLEIRNDGQAKLAVVVPLVFYSRDSTQRLPATWSTTSDAIAAVLAIETGAAELVWLKSIASASSNPKDWIEEGLIDPSVRCLLEQLPETRVHNLRSP